MQQDFPWETLSFPQIVKDQRIEWNKPLGRMHVKEI